MPTRRRRSSPKKRSRSPRNRPYSPRRKANKKTQKPQPIVVPVQPKSILRKPMSYKLGGNKQHIMVLPCVDQEMEDLLNHRAYKYAPDDVKKKVQNNRWALCDLIESYKAKQENFPIKYSGSRKNFNRKPSNRKEYT